MERERKTALIAGLLFIATFVTAIAAMVLYKPLLDDPGYLLGDGADTRVAFGAVLELLLIVANIGTAVVLFPVLKRQSESAALGYVAARVMECAFIAVGVLSLLTVLTLRQDATGSPAELAVAGETLLAIHDWTFVLGPGFVVGIGNGLLLGYLMWRSGLVPRRMAILGLVGGPLVCASGAAVVLGAIEPGSAPQALATLPEIAWEASLGIYLTVKGFRRPSPSAPGQDRHGSSHLQREQWGHEAETDAPGAAADRPRRDRLREPVLGGDRPQLRGGAADGRGSHDRHALR